MSKNFFKNGKWIDNPNTISVLICSCGNKYIKTRDRQAVCLSCISKVAKTA